MTHCTPGIAAAGHRRAGAAAAAAASRATPAASRLRLQRHCGTVRRAERPCSAVTVSAAGGSSRAQLGPSRTWTVCWRSFGADPAPFCLLLVRMQDAGRAEQQGLALCFLCSAALCSHTPCFTLLAPGSPYVRHAASAAPSLPARHGFRGAAAPPLQEIAGVCSCQRLWAHRRCLGAPPLLRPPFAAAAAASRSGGRGAARQRHLEPTGAWT